MDELIALIDSATGDLGGDARGLTSAYRDYNDGCDPEHLVEFVTVSSDFYPELRALLRRGGEGVAGAPRRLSDCDDTPMLSHSMLNLAQARVETVSASAPSRPARRRRLRSFSAG